jgi:hypothetical protein
LLETIFGPDTFEFRTENKNAVVHENSRAHVTANVSESTFRKSLVKVTAAPDEKQAPKEQLKKHKRKKPSAHS